MPVSLDYSDHLLFSFAHISVAGAMAVKSPNEVFFSFYHFPRILTDMVSGIIFPSFSKLPLRKACRKFYGTFKRRCLRWAYIHYDMRFYDIVWKLLRWLIEWWCVVSEGAYLQSIETPIGYAWVRLFKNDRLLIEDDEEEIVLPISADLPSGYINYQSFGLGKEVRVKDFRCLEMTQRKGYSNCHWIWIIILVLKLMHSRLELCV